MPRQAAGQHAFAASANADLAHLGSQFDTQQLPCSQIIRESDQNNRSLASTPDTDLDTIVEMVNRKKLSSDGAMERGCQAVGNVLWSVHSDPWHGIAFFKHQNGTRNGASPQDFQIHRAKKSASLVAERGSVDGI